MNTHSDKSTRRTSDPLDVVIVLSFVWGALALLPFLIVFGAGEVASYFRSGELDLNARLIHYCAGGIWPFSLVSATYCISKTWPCQPWVAFLCLLAWSLACHLCLYNSDWMPQNYRSRDGYTFFEHCKFLIAGSVPWIPAIASLIRWKLLKVSSIEEADVVRTKNPPV